jgi:hypothetical protein
MLPTDCWICHYFALFAECSEIFLQFAVGNKNANKMTAFVGLTNHLMLASLSNASQWHDNAPTRNKGIKTT